MIPSPRGRLGALGFVLLLASVALPRAAAAGPPYTSPADGATYVLRQSNIIVRAAARVSETALRDEDAFVVAGSASGPISGRLHLAGDGRTILFDPDRPFEPGERVTCRVAAGLLAAPGGTGEPLAFAFTVAGPERDTLRHWRAPSEVDDALGDRAPDAGAPAAGASEPLPDDYPIAGVRTAGRTAPGRIFLSSLEGPLPGLPGYLLEIANDGAPAFYRRLAGGSVDFKQQPDGRLTYFDEIAGCFYALDESYAVVDSFRVGNGYVTDHHDLQLLPNGHALLMAYDPQIVDMTAVDPKGRPDATVIGLVIQELDAAKDVIFQWRSWDHFRITDAVGVPFGASVVDYVHGNSIAVAPDGNLVISSRHLEEVTKIDRETGEILWRLGGKNNQFAFVGDRGGFSRQHDARVLANGNLTLFDNGNLSTPRVSRALEYQVDERRMTATLVWAFRHDPDVFSAAMGSVQRLPNGNTVIGWGLTGPAYTEVTAGGEVVQEVSLAPGVRSYRAFRFERPAPLPIAVAFAPRTLNPESGGALAATVQSAPFPAEAIDPATVRLDDAIPAEGIDEGAGIATFRFGRAALLARLAPGDHLVSLSGGLRSGARFRGYAPLSIVRGPSGRAEAAFVRVLSRPGALPLVLAVDDALGSARGAGRAETALSIFDVHGRLVARPRLIADGAGRLAWNGRGADGRPLSAGIYFARVENAPGGPVRKIVIVR